MLKVDVNEIDIANLSIDTNMIEEAIYIVNYISVFLS